MALFDINIDRVEDIIEIRRLLIQGTFVDNGGLTVVSWTSEGQTVSKQWAISAARLLEETKAYLQAYDPDLYGKRIKRLSPYYT